LEDARMAGREDEAVPVRPLGIGGVRPEELAEEDIAEGSERHRRSRMPRPRRLDGVHRQRADGLDRELLEILAHDIPSVGLHGAGKTTLLRILTGETSYQGGELAFQKGTRIALHDQRPPLERDLSLREYVLTGAAELVGVERELARLEQAMAEGAHDATTLGA